jgi:hypothetical protein
MPLFSTYDEQDTGFFSSNASAYSDAPFSLSTTFVLAPGTLNSAKGLLPAISGVSDKDVYRLGTLFNGNYSFSASGSFWFFGNGYTSFPYPTIKIYDSKGIQIAGGFSSNISIEVSTPGEYFLSVEGTTYQSTQYETYYTFTPPTNISPTNNSLSIIGELNVGGIVGTNGSFTDGNGLTFAKSTPDGYKYSWYTIQGSDINKVGESNFYTITNADAGKSLAFAISYTDDAGYFEVIISEQEQISTLNSAPIGEIFIQGTPTQGQKLTATNTLADADGLGSITYTWKAGTTIIGTGSTYYLTQAEVGQEITVTASYIDGLGKLESITSEPTNAVLNLNDSPYINTTPPLSATQGIEYSYSLTASDPDGDTVYFDLTTIVLPSWITRDGSTFSGTPKQADVGVHQVKIPIQDNNGGTSSQDFSITVANVNDPPSGSVTASGTPAQGQTLTASNTLSDLDGLGEITYIWKVGGTTLGAGASYTLTQAEVGTEITVTASYIDSFGTSESVTSNPTSAVENVNDDPSVDTSPALNATQGKEYSYYLTASDPDGDQVYFDLANLVLPSWITRTGGTFSGTPTQADVGVHQVKIPIYDNNGGRSSQDFFITVANVNDAPTGSVTIAGTAALGQTLTASNTLIDPDGLGAITYTWKAGNSTLGTGATYTLTTAEVGKTVIVTASYIDGGNTAESVTSQPSGPVSDTEVLTLGSLSPADWLVVGDEKLTFDSKTNLEWLDITETVNISYNSVIHEINSQGIFKGFRIATRQEVEELLLNSGIASNLFNKNIFQDAELFRFGEKLTELIGNTRETIGSELWIKQIYGNTSAVNEFGDPYYTIFQVSDRYQDTEGRYLFSNFITAGFTQINTNPSNYIGTWLVRSAEESDTNDAPTGSVTINGTAALGQTLTASNTLVDPDGLGAITYTWKAGSSTLGTGTTYTLTTAEVGKTITVTASYIDGGNTAESVTSTATAPVAAIAAFSVDTGVRAWNSANPLQGVDVSVGDQTKTTDTTGLAKFSSVSDPFVSVSASFASSSGANSETAAAITLQDAISILKMIAGQPMNAEGAPPPRTQSLAADFDSSGTVSLADALGVLRHAVGLQAPKPSWVFVQEGDDELSSILSPGVPGPVTVDVTPPGPIEVNLIGVLRGDVDGSYGVYPV